MSEHCGRVTEHTKRRGKIHRCSWCGQIIAPGERYAKWLYFDAGARDTVYAHAECHDAWMECSANEPGGIAYANGDCERPKRRAEMEKVDWRVGGLSSA